MIPRFVPSVLFHGVSARSSHYSLRQFHMQSAFPSFRPSIISLSPPYNNHLATGTARPTPPSSPSSSSSSSSATTTGSTIPLSATAATNPGTSTPSRLITSRNPRATLLQPPPGSSSTCTWLSSPAVPAYPANTLHSSATSFQPPLPTSSGAITSGISAKIITTGPSPNMGVVGGIGFFLGFLALSLSRGGSSTRSSAAGLQLSTGWRPARKGVFGATLRV